MRNGKIIGRENFIFRDVEDELESETIMSFLKQFYEPEDRFIPKDIVIKTCFDECELISQWLSGRKGSKVTLITPKKGEKKELLDMVQKNVEVELVRQDGDTTIVLGYLAELVGIKGEIKRIESYDISNLGSDAMVASMIVFTPNGFDKSEYKRFKIKTVSGQSDVDCMREVISRRFFHDDIPMPDLIMLDGGGNQINAVKGLINSIDDSIVICGMYKDNKHRTKGLMLENEEKIELKDMPQIFKMATKIQDEVHRFAIEYHRKLRSKELSKSVLDEIEGIGEKRKLELLKHFGTIEKIKQASLEELQQISGMDKRASENIINYFKEGV